MPIPSMSEAEVSLRLAIYLVSNDQVESDVSVALDGAQIRVEATQYFNVLSFLEVLGWRPEERSERWQGRYVNQSATYAINIHSQPGVGDVSAILRTGESLVVEAKKGTLGNSRNSSEYKLLREALGQLLTLETLPENAVLAVAVPHGERFVKLAKRWREAPMIKHFKICILTVTQDGDVAGW